MTDRPADSAPVCRWCKKTKAEHLPPSQPNRPRYRMPCLGWQENFTPVEDSAPAPAEVPDVRCVLIEAAKHYLEKSFGPYKKSVVDDAWKLLQMATVHAMSDPSIMDTEELRRAIEGDKPVPPSDWAMKAAHEIYSHIAKSNGSIPAAANIILKHATDAQVGAADAGYIAGIAAHATADLDRLAEAIEDAADDWIHANPDLLTGESFRVRVRALLAEGIRHERDAADAEVVEVLEAIAPFIRRMDDIEPSHHGTVHDIRTRIDALLARLEAR